VAPPPQETEKNSRSKGASHRYRRQRRADHWGARAPGKNNIPSAMVHNHEAGVGRIGMDVGRERSAVTRAMVATLMANVVGVVALNA
jgi:hypothetical protein